MHPNGERETRRIEEPRVVGKAETSRSPGGARWSAQQSTGGLFLRHIPCELTPETSRHDCAAVCLRRRGRTSRRGSEAARKRTKSRRSPVRRARTTDKREKEVSSDEERRPERDTHTHTYKRGEAHTDRHMNGWTDGQMDSDTQAERDKKKREEKREREDELRKDRTEASGRFRWESRSTREERVSNFCHRSRSFCHTGE